MKKSERCLAILEILQRQHKVTVTDLAQRFGISEMTIRRDLNFLARQYNISRTHGGAELGNQPVVRMISFDEARIAHKETKEKIAAMAATMIRSGQRIFVDAGSTTRIILNYLNEETKAMEENPDDALNHAEEPELVQGQEETDRMAAPDPAMLQNYANCGAALESMEDVLSSLDEFSDEILNEFSESMKELFDEMGLDELSDSVLSVEKDMDPADLKMMKIKHRNKEMKDIVCADAKYLKAVFDHLEKTRSEGTVVPDNSGAVTFGTSGQEAAPVINIVL